MLIRTSSRNMWDTKHIFKFCHPNGFKNADKKVTNKFLEIWQRSSIWEYWKHIKITYMAIL